MCRVYCLLAVLSAYGEAYLFAGAVAFVRSVKTGAPFAETSPMLHATCQLPSWRQVLIKTNKLLRCAEGELMENTLLHRCCIAPPCY